MKTRTLLLLAVVCGMAILVAGTVQLLRVADQKSSSPPIAVGTVGTAGDARVTLVGVAAAVDTLTATITVSGVDDPDGISQFRMVATGEAREVTGGTCHGLTDAPQQCTLVFDNAGLEGTPRQLLFRRAGEQLRWVLVDVDGVAV